ncbi:hypothetical protein [Nonomuraea mesophila]|nr:hypothetical protein [Nonomuraea mesophila]
MSDGAQVTGPDEAADGMVPAADWCAEPEDVIRQDLTRHNVLAGLGRTP